MPWKDRPETPASDIDVAGVVASAASPVYGGVSGVKTMTVRRPLAVVLVLLSAATYVACAQDRFEEIDEAPGRPDVFEATPELCSDGIDNDGDGFADCCDIFCAEVLEGVCTLVQAMEDNDARCSDCQDNDGNGFTDCADNACADNPNVTVCEDTDEECSDGIDNDGNGFADCQDRTCQRSDAVTVCPTEDNDEVCSDGIDNDFDGFPDCEDFDCSPPNVTVCD